MKKIILSLALLGSSYAYAQTYVSFVPSLTNTAGTIKDKANLSLEAGEQWDVFSLGVDIGKTTLSKQSGKDTSTYFEIRPNLNIFQQGKWTNTITTGVGFVMNAEENFLVEFTSGIEYSYSKTVHINVYYGQYYYSGVNSASNVSFFGISIMRYFLPAKTKGILNK